MILAYSLTPSWSSLSMFIRSSGKELCGAQYPRAEHLLWECSLCPKPFLSRESQTLENRASRKGWPKDPRLPPPRILVLQNFREVTRLQGRKGSCPLCCQSRGLRSHLCSPSDEQRLASRMRNYEMKHLSHRQMVFQSRCLLGSGRVASTQNVYMLSPFVIDIFKHKMGQGYSPHPPLA